MKKTWEEPKIMVQKFVANEYVAACSDVNVVYNFECNAGKPYTHYAVKDSKGYVATISGKSMDGIFSYYTPCGETHQAESDSGFLEGTILIIHGHERMRILRLSFGLIIIPMFTVLRSLI